MSGEQPNKPAARRTTRTAGGEGSGVNAPAARRSAYPEAVQTLIDELARLPGIGRRSAERLAFHVLKAERAEAMKLARAIEEVKRSVRHCPVCFNLTDAQNTAPGDGPTGGLCAVCAAEGRSRGVVMVVEQPKDLIALEQTGSFKGVYHVLMGRISPLDGVGPGDLTIRGLMRRVEDPATNGGGVRIEEVILALNPTLEGDGTALYLSQELAKRGVRVTRLARGLPTGSPLEYASKAVLADAIEGRRPMG